MALRPKHVAVVVALFASACAAITGIDGYSVGNGNGSSDGGSGNPSDGGTTLADGAVVVPTPPDGGKLPDDCTTGQVACESANTAAKCENGKWTRTACPEVCDVGSGACAPYLSCRNDAGADCGKDPMSCCRSLPVPGGTFNRANDATLPATVSAFELDAFEVTVGRFRAFLAAGGATQAHVPTPGTGAHPKLPDSGWHSEWNVRLPADVAETVNNINDGRHMWTDAPGANEHRPINNIVWLQAFAFCAWDGARLPTFAELSFAATGGSDQRVYPWSVPPSTTISPSQAAYNCNFQPPVKYCSTTCTGCSDADIAPVGSLAGVGKFGQFDLAGNVAEFTLDFGDNDPDTRPPPVCNDCALFLGPYDPQKAMIGTKNFTANFFSLGGAYDSGDNELRNDKTDRRRYDERHDQQGFRCARNARVRP